MENNRKYPQRKLPRMKGYDYSQEGAYFVTICTYQKQFLFGYIENDSMHLNIKGNIASQKWHELPQHFPSIDLDAVIVMPNHVHAIIILQPSEESAPQLSTVIGSYKSGVTRLIHKQFPQEKYHKVWQGSFHDHIIRNEKSYQYIRNYVLTNPERWREDTFYYDE